MTSKGRPTDVDATSRRINTITTAYTSWGINPLNDNLSCVYNYVRVIVPFNHDHMLHVVTVNVSCFEKNTVSDHVKTWYISGITSQISIPEKYHLSEVISL